MNVDHGLVNVVDVKDLENKYNTIIEDIVLLPVHSHTHSRIMYVCITYITAATYVMCVYYTCTSDFFFKIQPKLNIQPNINQFCQFFDCVV